ncbi:uncharacterized protein Dwil_GK27518 [Drosophila willistoni]|nr:uncharacterized protein Dwil_GK27518 [Drosophila willistoni]
MTAIPVVWCTDPNSVNNKPTAFALHGIQLQGNVTKKQVHALREFVNAAAEGRLILPSDGTFMLLDSGVSIESSIMAKKEQPQTPVNKNTYILMPVKGSSSSSATATMPSSTIATPSAAAVAAAAAQLEFLLEPKYSSPPPSMVDTHLIKVGDDDDEEEEGGNRRRAGEGDADDDILYEFLCCAKCMNEQHGGQQHNGNSCAGRRLKRYLRHSSKCNSDYDLVVNDLPIIMDDPVCSIATKYNRRQQRYKQSGTISMGIARNRPSSSSSSNNRHHKLPMHSVKIFHNRSASSSSSAALSTSEPPLYAVVSKREKQQREIQTKTELVDSGKQQQLEQQQQLVVDEMPAVTMLAAVPEEPRDLISFDEDDNHPQSIEATTTTTTTSNTTEVMRKNSDFLSQILDQQFAGKEQRAKAHKRRTSYEEFKRLVKEIQPSEMAMDSPTALKRQNSRQRKSFASYFLPRRNSSTKERKTEQKQKHDQDKEPKKDEKEMEKMDKEMDLEQEKENVVVCEQEKQLQAYVKGLAAHKSTNSQQYRKNFKIYDKLVYGTIYDIIQRKNDIYQLTYQKYDKYMTYGTIYEILYRKTNTTTSSSSTSNASTTSLSSSSTNSATWQRKSLSSILEREHGKSNDVIYDIVKKKQQQQQKQQQLQRQQSAVTIISDAENSKASSANLGLIYDILQGEKLDTIGDLSKQKEEEENEEQKVKPVAKTTRFVVSQVDELPSAMAITAEAEANNSSVAPSKQTPTQTKPHKMRRLSNILSYSKSTQQPDDANTTDVAQDQVDSTKKKRSQAKRRIGVTNLLLPLDSEELYTRIIAQQRQANDNNSDPECHQHHSHPHHHSLMKSNSLDAISMSVVISPPVTPSPPRPRRSLKQHRCLQQQQHLQLQNATRQQQQAALVQKKKHSLDTCLMTVSVEAKPRQPLRRWSNQTPLKCNCPEMLSHHQQQLQLQQQQQDEKDCTCLPTHALTCVIEKSRSLPAAANSSSAISSLHKCNHLSCHPTTTKSNGSSSSKPTKKGKSRRLSEFTRGEFLNEKS